MIIFFLSRKPRSVGGELHWHFYRSVTRKPCPLGVELRFVSGVTRPIHVGYVRKEIAQGLAFAPPPIIQKGEVEEGIKVLNEFITEEEKTMSLKS